MYCTDDQSTACGRTPWGLETIALHCTFTSIHSCTPFVRQVQTLRGLRGGVCGHPQTRTHIPRIRLGAKQRSVGHWQCLATA